jgi:hypothetical protein
MSFTPLFFLAVAPLVWRGPQRSGSPVEVARQGLRISTPQGSAVDPIIISLDWSKPQPKIERAVIIFHGKGRNVESAYRTLQEAADKAGAAGHDTIFLAPQFLDEEDIGPYSAETLRWRKTDWESGALAIGPIPVGPFEIIDALLGRLADRSHFPNLKTIVLAGHSGGGQLVQRYAVVGRALITLAHEGIQARFVIANPSSYLYFSDDRPGADEKAGPFVAKTCPDFDHWKYGPADPVAYVTLSAPNDWTQMEANYAQRDVIYLLGTADTDPHEKDLDVSCSGEAQGPTRFVRGQAYYAYLHGRNPAGWNQHMWFVPGVAHSARDMFTAKCGVNAIFDLGRCPDQ